jgi:phage terminase large subunit
MDAKLQTNKIFEILQDSKKRITVMQGGSRCFTGETLVRCKDDYKTIADIPIGELVYSIDNNFNPVLRKVVDKFIYKTDKNYHNVITFILHNNEKITCTYGHKLLQEDGYVKAEIIAERMLGRCNWEKIAKYHYKKDNYTPYTSKKKLAQRCLDDDDIIEIIFHETAETVYDIEVEEFHNYFVTTENIISHNSGKTYNILIWFIVKLLQENGKTLTIVRQSLPSIKGSVLRDFVDILSRLGIYSEDNHNKTEQIYQLNGNVVEFVSADQPQKIRGRARTYLFCNEANELSYEAWMQLIMRTEGKIVIDYNPSDISSWIYDDVIPRDDADFYITTFRDNPFLPKELVDELERLKDADPNYWQIYGLGERGLSQDLIYTHYRTTEQMPEGETVYGLDFGFNVPSAMVKVVFYENAAYVQELIYETKLTTNDLVEKIVALGIDKFDEIYCDAAEPKTIEELVRQGLNAKPANKDVLEGIRSVKATPLYIHQDSVNLLKEVKNYRWKTDRNGNKLDQPVKFNDHISDAMRYAIFSKLTIPSVTWGAI